MCYFHRFKTNSTDQFLMINFIIIQVVFNSRNLKVLHHSRRKDVKKKTVVKPLAIYCRC